MGEIVIPAHGWEPRSYQRKLWAYMENGGRRAYEIAHRRWGKDDVALNWAAVSALQKIGNYWHMLPEASQARKAIWDAVNPHTGRRRIDEAFPKEIRETTKEQEMFIRFINGATWQVVGSDNFNSLVGSTPIGVVFSEWALANPSAWAFLSPILLENGGWAMFITTPRGRNHAKRFYDSMRDNPNWFCEVSSVERTGRFTHEQLEEERAQLIAQFGEDDGNAKFEQEYDCSFDAAIQGSYYGKLLKAADNEDRIGHVPYNPSLPVITAWDLGIGDSTVIWCAQQVGSDVRVIDCIASSGVGIDWYVKELANRPYIYKQHIVPHDAENSELGTGMRRIDTMRSLGMNPIRVLPRTAVDDGISAVRMLIPRCRFDRKGCKLGIDALEQYRKSWDDANKCFRDKPLHDWASDYADAFRYLAVGLRDKEVVKRQPAKPRLQTSGTPGGWMGM
ncbi:hypothetical protein D3W54_14735 [Komagataeibacter medellinensis]|uniref:Phage terminase large subunit n=1 Tax=Komagataeibacter medellinensis TaxID=1177712 RepID=A0ABQ6VR74_9PROT|nr:terminase family protein [Komagataeibacter medellinensis]KAB8122444.1 hypothetical protein D3W54_14735 [Komagataeibacter medellinensis]